MASPDFAFRPILTERLSIRRYRPSDLSEFLAIRLDPATRLYQSFPDDETPEMALAFFAEMDAREPGADLGWFNFCLARRRDDLVVGDIGFNRRGASAEIGYTIGPRWRGGGFATEAVGALIDWLGGNWAVSRIEAEIDGRNGASRAVLGHLGFSFVAAFTENGDSPFQVEQYALETADFKRAQGG